MTNTDNFIAESKAYFVKRGWNNVTLFNQNDSLLFLAPSYFINSNTITGKQFLCTSKEKFVIWIFEHISNLWIKNQMGERTILIGDYYVIINKFGIPQIPQ